MVVRKSQSELRLARRLRAANRRKLGRGFHFILHSITAGTLVNVDVLVDLANKVAALSRGHGLEQDLAGIVVFPIIADAEVYVRDDFVTHKRSDRAYYVGKNIDYDSWRHARRL